MGHLLHTMAIVIEYSRRVARLVLSVLGLVWVWIRAAFCLAIGVAGLLVCVGLALASVAVPYIFVIGLYNDNKILRDMRDGIACCGNPWTGLYANLSMYIVPIAATASLYAVLAYAVIRHALTPDPAIEPTVWTVTIPSLYDQWAAHETMSVPAKVWQEATTIGQAIMIVAKVLFVATVVPGMAITTFAFGLSAWASRDGMRALAYRLTGAPYAHEARDLYTYIPLLGTNAAAWVIYAAVIGGAFRWTNYMVNKRARQRLAEREAGHGHTD